MRTSAKSNDPSHYYRTIGLERNSHRRSERECLVTPFLTAQLKAILRLHVRSARAEHISLRMTIAGIY